MSWHEDWEGNQRALWGHDKCFLKVCAFFRLCELCQILLITKRLVHNATRFLDTNHQQFVKVIHIRVAQMKICIHTRIDIINK